MTATVIGLFDRQVLAPTVPCPTWCQSCGDGMHERLVFHTTAADDVDGATRGVMVTLEREDATAAPGPVDVVLKVGAEGVRLTRAQRVDLAAALLAANDLDAEAAA